MKLRIAGQSLRFRLSRSDVSRFIDVGKIEETIYFAPEEYASFSYALAHVPSDSPLAIRYREREITVIVASSIAEHWASEGIGIEGRVETSHGALELLIEKDFACLHGDDRDNKDAFPNPLEPDRAEFDTPVTKSSVPPSNGHPLSELKDY
jgi:hypothetical protein